MAQCTRDAQTMVADNAAVLAYSNRLGQEVSALF
jgi:hypothetical protein